MPYITECRAPHISDLGATLLSRFHTGVIFGGRKQPELESVSRLLTGYLFVVDKASREYSAGREALTAYARSENQSSLLFFEALGRFETCIHSAKRAFRYLERLTSHREGLAIEKTLRRLLHNWDNTLTSIRDEIEHMDKDIAAESLIAAGMSHLLIINSAGDQLEIASHRISLADLARVVRRLHEAGCELIDLLPKNI